MGHAMVVGGARASVPETGILAGDLAVGSSVYLMENGVAVEYLVVNQGIPSSSSLYDASCDGTWLLRKDCIAARAWDAGSSNMLETSDIHTWLNADMLAKYDIITQNAIKQVKVPYCPEGGINGYVVSGKAGLPCKVFMLSGYEVGFTKSDSSSFPVDGAKLDYFESGDGTSAYNKRIAYLNGASVRWWTRSPLIDIDSVYIWCVQNDGSRNTADAKYNRSVRPTLILPPNASFGKNTLILKGVA